MDLILAAFICEANRSHEIFLHIVRRVYGNGVRAFTKNQFVPF